MIMKIVYLHMNEVVVLNGDPMESRGIMLWTVKKFNLHELFFEKQKKVSFYWTGVVEEKKIISTEEFFNTKCSGEFGVIKV